MPKAVSLRNLRPWRPGQSGNPNGRPWAPGFTERDQHAILMALAGEKIRLRGLEISGPQTVVIWDRLHGLRPTPPTVEG
jgi:hypothetical protein